MTADSRSTLQRTLRSVERTEAQQSLVAARHLDAVPDELDHPEVIDAQFLGVPGETTVFCVRFTPLLESVAALPTKWLLEVQDHGWDIVSINEYTRYVGRTRTALRHLPVVGSHFGETGLNVQVQHPDPARSSPTDSGVDGERGDDERGEP